MTRSARNLIGESIYHVYSRGINREAIFSSDFDRNIFLKYALEAKLKHGVDILFYCIMGNHYHFVIKNTHNKLSKFMQSINQRYAHLFNARHDRTGSIFDDRYKSLEITSLNYLSTLFAYVHLNPVKDSFCKLPENWKASSFSSYFKDTLNPLLSKNVLFELYGCENNLAAWQEIIYYMSQKYTSALHEQINFFLDKNQSQALQIYRELYECKSIKSVLNQQQFIDVVSKVLIEYCGCSFRFVAQVVEVPFSSLYKRYKKLDNSYFRELWTLFGNTEGLSLSVY